MIGLAQMFMLNPWLSGERLGVEDKLPDAGVAGVRTFMDNGVFGTFLVVTLLIERLAFGAPRWGGGVMKSCR